jgi:hypothetical protein
MLLHYTLSLGNVDATFCPSMPFKVLADRRNRKLVCMALKAMKDIGRGGNKHPKSTMKSTTTATFVTTTAFCRDTTSINEFLRFSSSNPYRSLQTC